MRLLYIAACLMLFTPVKAEVKPFSEFRGWDIDLYIYDSGEPYACLGSVSYKQSNTMLMVGFEKRGDDDLLTLSIWNEAWASIEQGKEYELEIEFPRDEWTLTGSGGEIDQLFFVQVQNILNEKAWGFIADFRKSLSMKVSIKGNLIGNFTLKGSSGMILDAWKCYKGQVQSFGDDPFSESPKSSKSKDVTDPFDI